LNYGEKASQFVKELMISNISWLMGEPAGFKINERFSPFLGTLAKNCIEYWSTIAHTFVKPLERDILRIIIFSGIFGFSMILSVIEDVISLLSLHIYCFYFAAARLYSWQLNVLSSLWRLFRGKKKMFYVIV